MLGVGACSRGEIGNRLSRIELGLCCPCDDFQPIGSHLPPRLGRVVCSQGGSSAPLRTDITTSRIAATASCGASRKTRCPTPDVASMRLDERRTSAFPPSGYSAIRARSGPTSELSGLKLSEFRAKIHRLVPREIASPRGDVPGSDTVEEDETDEVARIPHGMGYGREAAERHSGDHVWPWDVRVRQQGAQLIREPRSVRSEAGRTAVALADARSVVPADTSLGSESGLCP